MRNEFLIGQGVHFPPVLPENLDGYSHCRSKRKLCLLLIFGFDHLFQPTMGNLHILAAGQGAQ
jgi:hypothetical protein